MTEPKVFQGYDQDDGHHIEIVWPLSDLSLNLTNSIKASMDLYNKHSFKVRPFCFHHYEEAQVGSVHHHLKSKFEIWITDGHVYNPYNNPSIQGHAFEYGKLKSSLVIYTDKNGKYHHDIEPALAVRFTNDYEVNIWVMHGVIHRENEPAIIKKKFFNKISDLDFQNRTCIYKQLLLAWYKNGHRALNRFGWNIVDMSEITQDDFGSYYITNIYNGIVEPKNEKYDLEEQDAYSNKFLSTMQEIADYKYCVNHNNPSLCIEKNIVTKSLSDTFMRGNSSTYYWCFFEGGTLYDGSAIYGLAQKYHLKIHNFYGGGPLFTNIEEEMLFVVALSSELKENPNLSN